MVELQTKYWDGFSQEYQQQLQISCEDFHYGPQIPGELELRLLPQLKPGMRALELGCGGGQNSIWLARQGIECVGVDISANQLARARELAVEHGVELELVQSTMEGVAERVEGKFDLIHSARALEFVDDPAGVVASAAQLLVPGGTLVIATTHPLYNGDWLPEYDEDGAVTGFGVYMRSYFEPQDDIRRNGEVIEFVSRAYPVSAWFNWYKRAGLSVVELSEPAAVADGAGAPYTNDDWADHDGLFHAIPTTLIIVGCKG